MSKKNNKRSQSFDGSKLVLIHSPFPYRELPNRIGQWVELNSGGPHMLIVDIDADEMVCAWIDGGQVVEHTFKPETLKFCF